MVCARYYPSQSYSACNWHSCTLEHNETCSLDFHSWYHLCSLKVLMIWASKRSQFKFSWVYLGSYFPWWKVTEYYLFTIACMLRRKYHREGEILW
jgi:hypothetical protein